MQTYAQAVGATTYPGRGILSGRTADGKKLFSAYFIMGRSENSRNRVFVRDGEGIRTQAFDPSKMKDPSLIIYAPVRKLNGTTIITNGDQTDTIYDALAAGKTFADALRTRAFEPDAPNFTPRISLAFNISDEKAICSKWSVLKAADPEGKNCMRCFYEYEDMPAGEGRFIHTYMSDGAPIPSFSGEPEKLTLEDDFETMTNNIWAALNADNKVSLWTEMVDLETGAVETKIINRNV